MGRFSPKKKMDTIPDEVSSSARGCARALGESMSKKYAAFSYLYDTSRASGELLLSEGLYSEPQ